MKSTIQKFPILQYITAIKRISLYRIIKISLWAKWEQSCTPWWSSWSEMSWDINLKLGWQ